MLQIVGAEEITDAKSMRHDLGHRIGVALFDLRGA